jgi:hypothetical protein
MIELKLNKSRRSDKMRHMFFNLLLLTAVVFTACLQVYCQQPSTKSKKAIDAYNNGLEKYTLHDYRVAATFLLDAIAADPEFLEAYLILAEVYEDDNQPLKSIEIYRKGLPIQESYYPYGFVRLGNLEYLEGMYENALQSYKKFLSLNPNNASYILKARSGIERCEFSLNAVHHPVQFNPVNLGPAVNTPNDEYWPSLSVDEQTLVITRLLKSDNPIIKYQEDFFISHWSGNEWAEMKNAGSPLNTSNNEGAQTISGDGRLMIFTACNRADGQGRCDLYYSVKSGEEWSLPKNMGKPVNTSYRETQPSIAPDGRTLYFSSDRPGGKGQHDIWVSYLNDNDKWAQPINLGDTINSSGTELSPFIHPDNQSLYFSSDGHLGLGGYDLFVSRRNSNGRWLKPENLGYPINTNRDEIGLIVNPRGNLAYYSSDMNKVNGKDIYVFDLPVQSQPTMVTYMKGKVFDVTTNTLLKAVCELIDLETGKTVYSFSSDSLTGEFIISIPVHRNYMLNASRAGYLFFSENFSLRDTIHNNKPYYKDIPLQPLKVGNSIVLKNVFYETDSFALKKESTIELNKVAGLLKANPGIRIEISGHTDNTGNAIYNQRLSENRAKTVVDYLISSHIDASRIIYKGYGMDKPVSENSNEEGRSQNRRTELKIIE